MRSWVALSFLVVLSSPLVALAGADNGAAGRLQQAFPEAQLLRTGGQLERVWGGAFGYGVTAQDSAAAFVQDYSGLWNVSADELGPGNTFDGQLSTELMLDPQTGGYKFTLLYYSQHQDGIPVFRADLRLLVRNEAGYPLVLAASTLCDLGGFAVPADALTKVDVSAAQAAAKALVPGLLNFEPYSVVIWPGDKSSAPAVAIVFMADNGRRYLEDWAKWLFVADAASGRILYQEDQIVHIDVTGQVHGLATTLPKSAECNPEVDTPMPYAKVSIGATTVYADASGNFTIPNAGATPVTVTSYMSGYRFNISDQGGGLETLSLTVTPPGPANFMHNAANTSEFIRAEVNAYVQCNVVRDWILLYKPDYPTITSETGFQVNVNLNQTCNAYYDGTLNLFRAGGGCANTSYSNVIHHEYGHHVVQMGGSGQDAYGEGMGDCVAMLVANDPVLGYGFQNNCNAGIRNANNSVQYPCNGEIHDCGMLLSGCIWSTRTELLNAGFGDYLAIVSNLTVNSVPLHSGGTISPSIYTDFITLDGGLGGPHYAQITAGFAAHNMTPGAPPANDYCADATWVCPGTYNGATMAATVDGSAGCGTSDATPDVWFKYRPAAGGSLSLELCNSDYDTVLSVHSGCPGTSGNQLACNDDTGWFGACGILPTSQSALTLSVAANTTYWIRISGFSGATGAYSLDVAGPACVPADTTPPSPNPMTFAEPPVAAGSAAVSMTATTATDASSPPVQYEFEFVSGGTGGAGSGWQSSTVYTNSGLAPDTAYTYRVRARDSAAPPNVTGFSGNAAATTLANTPAAPVLSNATSHTLDLAVASNGNPAYTLFAIQCTGSNPTDLVWNGQYLDSSGQPTAAAVWQTAAQWGTRTVWGLQAATEYSFAVQARNQDGLVTAFGPSAALATTAAGVKGDLNCDGAVNFADINPFVLAISNPAAYAAEFPDCNILNADCDNDGLVNFADINPFVALLAGP